MVNSTKQCGRVHPGDGGGGSGQGRSGGLPNNATNQDQSQGHELINSNICWSVGTGEWTSLLDSKIKDLYKAGEQQNNQEEFQC